MQEIRTKWLLLRPFRESDYDDLLELRSQPENDEFEGYPGIRYENGRQSQTASQERPNANGAQRDRYEIPAGTPAAAGRKEGGTPSVQPGAEGRGSAALIRNEPDEEEGKEARTLMQGNTERQSKLKQTACVCMLAAMFFLLTGCGTGSVFDGSRVSDASGFRIEYSILNRKESADLNLTEGDRLRVFLSHTAGTVDVTVGRDGNAPIYRGNGQQNADFVLEIPETGTYRISVSGHQAKGNVSFTRIPGEDGMKQEKSMEVRIATEGCCGREEITMLFKGIGRTFSTENDQQYETIRAFWDELAAKYGRVNLQGLGYGWTERSIEYAIGLIDGEIGGADRTVKLPDTGWVAVQGRTADLGEIYEKIYQEGRLNYEIERFTDSGECEIMYCRSTSGNG